LNVKLGYFAPNQLGGLLEFSNIDVENVYYHDDYDGDSQTDDIALIELPSAVDFSGRLLKNILLSQRKLDEKICSQYQY
jgi:hypothetical protein